MRIAIVIIALIALWSAPGRAQDEWDDGWGEEELPVEIHGYVEAAGAARVTDDPTMADDFVLGEARFRLDLAHYTDRTDFSFKGDFMSDAITDEQDIDIRAASLLLRLGARLDVRAGRQVLTWGTGDLVFLNDLFPKDFVSFFVGRDDEFLKAPSNSIKVSGYANALNIDLVWTPIFAPDRYITGERLSFYDPSSGDIVSAETMGEAFIARSPERTVENSETAARLYRNLGGYELAAYGYWGFFKQPNAFDEADDVAVFAPLAVLGASARGNLAGGIFNAECAYYDSRDDRSGADPFLPNSQVRALVGYEKELAPNLTGSFQYYLEWLRHHDRLVANAPAPESAPNEKRELVTVRLTQRLMQETLTLSLFAFIAPDDGDSHWRPVVSRKFTDTVSVVAGANVMVGDKNTFFGQLENNANVYLRFRYSF